MELDVWLDQIAEFLVNAGVPAEKGPMAALTLIYLGQRIPPGLLPDAVYRLGAGRLTQVPLAPASDG